MIGKKSTGNRLMNFEATNHVLEEAIFHSWEAVFVLDSKARYRYINRVSGSITHQDPDNWLGQPAGTQIHPEDGEAAMVAFSRVLKGQKQSLDFRIKRPDGEYRILEVDLSPLDLDNEPHVLGMARDVTEQRESERKLCEERDRAQRYLDVAAVIMVALDREGRVTLLNRRGEEVLGYSEEELLGKDWFVNCIPERERQEVQSLHQSLFLHQLKNSTVENAVITRDGRERTISWKNTILTDDKGNVTGTLSSGEDVTDKKRVEQRLAYHLRLEAALARASRTLMSEEPQAPAKVLEIMGLATEASWSYIYRLNGDRFELVHDWTSPDLGRGRSAEVMKIADFPWSMQKILKGESVIIEDVDLLPPEAALEKAYIRQGETNALLVFPFFGPQGDVAGAIGFNDTSSRKDLVGEDEEAFQLLREMISRYFERKESREALEKSERLYRLLADSTVDAVWTMDMDLNMTYISPSVERLVGYTQEEYLALSLEDYLTPASKQKALEVFQEELSLQARGEGPDKERSRRFELEQITKDGRHIWVEIQARFLWDENDRLLGIHGLSRDITDRKNAEEALQRSEAKFRVLYDSTPDAVMLLNEKGYFDCNPAALEMFGVGSLEDLCTRHPADFSPPYQPDGQESKTKARKIIRRVMKEGADRFEWMHRRADNGREFPVEALLNRLELDGKTVLQGVIRDISDRKQMEEKLKKSEENYRLIFENMNDIVYSLDSELRVMQASPSVERILGYCPEDLLGKTIVESGILAPEYHEKALYDMQRVMAGEMIEAEYGLVVSDGCVRLFETNASPLYQREKIVGSIGVARDVTEKRAEEEARKEAELRYLSLFKNSKDGIFLHDLTGKFIDANDTALEMTGHTREDIPTLNFTHLVSSETELLKAMGNVKQMLETGVQPDPLEITLKRKDGSEIDIETMGAMIYKNEEPSYIIGFARDVTERNRMMKKLGSLSARLESEHSKLRSMLDNMTSSVIMADENHVVQDMNSSAKEFLQVSRNEVIGKSIHDFHNEGKNGVIGQVLKDLKEGTREVVALKRRIQNRWMDLRVSPIKDNFGQYRGVILNMIDVDMLVEARRQAEEANRAKSQFLANMSHEIRTPLNGVLGFAELLQRSGLDPKKQKYVETIISSGKHLLNLINQVLDLSRIEAGRTELDNRLFHPRSVVREAMEMIRPQADKKSLRLSCNISPAVPATAEADEAKIIQVLTNLAGNAVKFTEKGEIEFSADIDETGEGRLVFSVRDTGPGIPLEKQESIFRAFEQVEGGLTKEHEGTGLGLAISSRLVELMGGEISLQSGPGKGSTFTFKIPLQAGEGRERPGDGVDEKITIPQDDTKPTVLVIESDDKDRQGILEILNRLGANAVEQADPEEGLLSAQFYDPHAVVLGGWREEGPAAKLFEELRADPITGDVPVIAATYAESHHMPEENGPDARIKKPVQAGCLARALREAGVELNRTEEELPCNKDSLEKKADTDSPSLVLLVEDNPTNRQFVKEALKEEQWQVMEAENGVECLEILEDTRPDLILMDMAMPVMDGLEATRKIRQDERFKDIPVVALTASAMEGDREKCLEAGCNDYVAKPVKIDALLSAMERSLSRKGELK